jgi:23S rRNA (adenine2503-C2)-methyltransferase
MLQFSKKHDDPNGLVHKLIFEDNNSIAETVLYHYVDRVVVCFSTQSGCPVGCRFCGTGNKFIRDLTTEEMSLQIDQALAFMPSMGIETLKGIKVQLMSMSMGDPMLNWIETEKTARKYLEIGYYFFISTVGFQNWDTVEKIMILGEQYNKFGLQFSLHNIITDERLTLFRNGNLNYMRVSNLINVGRQFTLRTGKKAYFNFIITGNESEKTKLFLAKQLKGMHLTCSVLCNISEAKKTNPAKAIRFAGDIFELSDGKVDTSTFDPAGQDTIGGGCGQLLYVQEKMKQLIGV